MNSRGFYRISTVLLALLFGLSAIAYIRSEVLITAFHDLGFPSYFRVELALAQLLGAIALIFPVGRMLKEWAYAGFSFTLVSASLAHWARSDELSKMLIPLAILIFLLLSYHFYRTIER